MTTYPSLLKTQIVFGMMPLLFLFNSFLSFSPTFIPLNVNEINNRSCKSNQPLGKAKSYQVKTVVIDAGHGGKDSGCSGEFVIEKDIALILAKQLAASMRKVYPDLKIVLTRKDDTFIELYKRAEIANRNNADLFISIHCNASGGSKHAHGTETFVMGLHTAEQNLRVAKRENASLKYETNIEQNYPFDPYSDEGHIMASMVQNAYLDQSILFAKKIEEQFENADLRKSRGVKQAGFVVLKLTTMPSVLIETGFLTNLNEENYLSTPVGQRRVVQSILTAFGAYKKEVEKGVYQKTVVNTNLNNPSIIPSSNETDLNKSPNTRQPMAMNYARPKAKKYAPKIASNAKTNPRNNPKLRPKRAASNTSNQPEIKFRIQLAVASQMLNTNEAKWKNLGHQVEVFKEGDVFKYQAGSFTDLEAAERERMKIQITRFPDAFIVAYKNGDQITVADAKKELGLE